MARDDRATPLSPALITSEKAAEVSRESSEKRVNLGFWVLAERVAAPAAVTRKREVVAALA